MAGSDADAPSSARNGPGDPPDEKSSRARRGPRHMWPPSAETPSPELEPAPQRSARTAHRQKPRHSRTYRDLPRPHSALRSLYPSLLTSETPRAILRQPPTSVQQHGDGGHFQPPNS